MYECLSGTVARDEQAVVFAVDAAPLRHAAALSRLAVQATRTFLRLQSKCLVRLDDGCQPGRPVAHGAGHEPIIA